MHQTSGRLRAKNNNSERFFYFHAPGKCQLHQSSPGLDGMRSIDNAGRQVLFEQRIFPLIFISTIRQIFCLSPLLLMRIECQIGPLWIPFEHTNFLLDYSHKGPLKWPPRTELKLYQSLVQYKTFTALFVYYMFTNDLVFSLIGSFRR